MTFFVESFSWLFCRLKKRKRTIFFFFFAFVHQNDDRKYTYVEKRIIFFFFFEILFSETEFVLGAKNFVLLLFLLSTLKVLKSFEEKICGF